MNGRAARDIAILIAAYIGLSALCYWGHRLPVVNTVLSAAWPLKALLGPPAALLERIDGFAMSYTAGTVLVVPLIAIARVNRRRQPSTAVAVSGLCALIWAAWGVYELLIAV